MFDKTAPHPIPRCIGSDMFPVRANISNLYLYKNWTPRGYIYVYKPNKLLHSSRQHISYQIREEKQERGEKQERTGAGARRVTKDKESSSGRRSTRESEQEQGEK